MSQVEQLGLERFPFKEWSRVPVGKREMIEDSGEGRSDDENVGGGTWPTALVSEDLAGQRYIGGVGGGG